MTTNSQVPEETADPVSQAQAEMDAAQEGTPQEPQPTDAVAQQNQALLSEVAGLKNQVSGLHSRIDKGLDAIRRDERQRYEDGQRQREIDGQMAELPDETRKAMEPILKENARLRQEALAAPPAAPDPLEPAYQMAEALGVDRNDPRISYSVFSDQNLSGDDQIAQFGKSIRALIDAGQSHQTQSTNLAPQQQTQPPSPPANATPSATTGVALTPEAVRDLYITEKISTEDYMKKMREMGEPV